MGIFTRFKDIVSSNINAMLDKAEDPEKLIKLMIQEMEDTLVELKASCASTMATKSKIIRALDSVQYRVTDWENKARLAVSKGREDLAREALAEKRVFTEEADRLQKEIDQLDHIVEKYQSDIGQLEDKLANARKKHQMLIQRHTQAEKRYKAQSVLRKNDNSDAFARFDAFENRIERMEADADLVNAKSKPSLEDEFAKLEGDETLEKELAALKAEIENKSNEK
ncbi:phage shock protein PspA [Pelagicoccus sp. SDUM812003]|uniref:phage shock protein PspA n=1 Tax=Pelagicoccus sp. SDUM812003 TaxID=3041267 RepID=UPI00280FC9AC|nr:phage shock protein PspA [Pelagicoccus sp. SDUM812003]MDQ8202733.1 phage shock protein PspA [Pelagicoccus sp. SDUM812003]